MSVRGLYVTQSPHSWKTEIIYVSLKTDFIFVGIILPLSVSSFVRLNILWTAVHRALPLKQDEVLSNSELVQFSHRWHKLYFLTNTNFISFLKRIGLTFTVSNFLLVSQKHSRFRPVGHKMTYWWHILNHLPTNCRDLGSILSSETSSLVPEFQQTKNGKVCSQVGSQWGIMSPQFH